MRLSTESATSSALCVITHFQRLALVLCITIGYRQLFLDAALSVLLIIPKNNILLKCLNFKQKESILTRFNNF